MHTDTGTAKSFPWWKELKLAINKPLNPINRILTFWTNRVQAGRRKGSNKRRQRAKGVGLVGWRTKGLRVARLDGWNWRLLLSFVVALVFVYMPFLIILLMLVCSRVYVWLRAYWCLCHTMWQPNMPRACPLPSWCWNWNLWSVAKTLLV